MTLREYIISALGEDLDSFLSEQLTTLIMENGRILGSGQYDLCLDYEIKEIEYHVELDRNSNGGDDKSSSYHIITLYSKESA